jgi:cytoskeletal protein CcmA (bactofilin family)
MAQTAGAPAPRPAPQKTASLLSSDLTFEGNVSGQGDLHIDGAVRGDVRVGRLTVGETGNVEGSVLADYIEVRGRVVGAVNGKQVKLMGTAYVDGDITHEQLSIDVGAYFQGRCLQGRKDALQSQQAPVGFSAPSHNQGPTPQSAPTSPAQLIELKPGA